MGRLTQRFSLRLGLTTPTQSDVDEIRKTVKALEFANYKVGVANNIRERAKWLNTCRSLRERLDTKLARLCGPSPKAGA